MAHGELQAIRPTSAAKAVESSSFGPDNGPAEYLEVTNYVQNYVQQITWSSWSGPAGGVGR